MPRCSGASGRRPPPCCTWRMFDRSRAHRACANAAGSSGCRPRRPYRGAGNLDAFRRSDAARRQRAFRVLQWMNELARAMGMDALAVHIAIGGGMTATARRGGEHVTLASEIAPLGINASRLGLLERLAREARPGLTTAELAAKLKAIEAEPPFYSLAVTAAAVGAASGAFSFLNSGGPSEIVSAFIGGAVGQSLRSLLFRYRYNQYAVTALCAAIASGVYVVVAHALARAGLPVSPHAAGFISSALFLVPGFPLIAGLLALE